MSLISSLNRKLRLAGAFAALMTLALGVSCTGFFVDPTISSITVQPPSPTIETGTSNNTVQMTAQATNSDNQTVSNPSVTWTITPNTVATISTTGLVTSVSTGTATVTATSNKNASVSGSQTVTVTVGCVQTITVQPTSGTVTTNSPTVPLTAQAAT